jgi:hypothetical protein
MSAAVIVLSLSTPAVGGGTGNVPPTVVEALTCVVKMQGGVLSNLLPSSDLVSFGYASGAIPGTSPEDRVSAMNLLIYGMTGRKAVLLTAIASDGKWDVLADYYVLDRFGRGWRVVDGNGGQATYAAIAAFVNKIESRPMHTVSRGRLSTPSMCEKR